MQLGHYGVEDEGRSCFFATTILWKDPFLLRKLSRVSAVISIETAFSYGYSLSFSTHLVDPFHLSIDIKFIGRGEGMGPLISSYNIAHCIQRVS